MLPNFRDGQLVIGSSLAPYDIGKVVILRQDNGIEKIKRIAKKSEHEVFVLGDNPAESTDSRTLGWLPNSSVMASVITMKK